MKFPGVKRRPPFVTLPRHKRSHEVIRLKGKMRRDAAEYGGRFTSRLVLNEPGRPDLYNQWFDFYFPGTDRFTIWNASFVTARKAFWDKAHDLAHTRVGAMLTPEEREEKVPRRFVWNLTARIHRSGARWGLWATRQSELSTNPPGGAFC